jgi:hypothetical protein
VAVLEVKPSSQKCEEHLKCVFSSLSFQLLTPRGGTWHGAQESNWKVFLIKKMEKLCK